MFKYDKYIINSLIITKYINKTYQLKNKCLTFDSQVSKREIIPEECSTKDIFCNPQFVTLYKELQGR